MDGIKAGTGYHKLLGLIIFFLMIDKSEEKSVETKRLWKKLLDVKQNTHSKDHQATHDLNCIGS
jgi:hypothetical protein